MRKNIPVLRTRLQHIWDRYVKWGIAMVTPGGFNRFFEDLSSLNRGLAAPDLVRTEQLAGSLSAALSSSLLQTAFA